MLLFFVGSMSAAPEFRAGDGCCHGHVEAVGARCERWLQLAVVGEGSVHWSKAGNQQSPVHPLCHLCADAVALVTHHDDGLLRQFLRVDVVAVEQCAANGYGSVVQVFL